MRIKFELAEDEKITPIAIAEALINDETLSVYDIEEVSDHLNVYTRRKDRERADKIRAARYN